MASDVWERHYGRAYDKKRTARKNARSTHKTHGKRGQASKRVAYVRNRRNFSA